MENFFLYADNNQDETPAFIFDPKFADNVEELRLGFDVPKLFEDDLFKLLPNRPNFRYVDYIKNLE